MPAQERKQIRLRKAAGVAWLAIWIVVLYLVAAPWRELGGLVDERLRWLEWCVLVTVPPVGFTTGRFARDVAVKGRRRTHAHFLRILLYPAAILTAASLGVLAWIGERGPMGVVFTGFLCYWAGFDLAFGAVPLMEGRSYRFHRLLDPEPKRPKAP